MLVKDGIVDFSYMCSVCKNVWSGGPMTRPLGMSKAAYLSHLVYRLDLNCFKCHKRTSHTLITDTSKIP